MRRRNKLVLCLATFAFMLTIADLADAQCCPDYTPSTSCTNLTKTRWCIANDAPNGFGTATLPEAFCSYGEQVVSTLEMVFNIEAPKTFEFDLMTCESSGGNNCKPGQSTGYAQTPTSCGTFGNAVTYDAFTGNAYDTQYFWGYLLSLHEAINQWTGLASGGWPTDWWADHQSAFPNLMDFHIMNLVGTNTQDQNLLTGAAAQKTRFYPGGDSADPKVVALDNVYRMMPDMNGLAGFSKVFSLATDDKISWGNVGPNPSQKLSEYVIAYMALVVGKAGGQVLKTVQGPSANGGGNICDGTSDGQGDPTYMCSEADVDAIATAHCALAANGRPTSDSTAYGMGNFDSVTMGPCGANCPAECGCDTSTMNCVAPWLGTTSGTGSSSGSGGAASGGTGASSGSTGTSGASAGASGSSTSTSGGAGAGSGTTIASSDGGVISGSNSNGSSGTATGGGTGGSSSGETSGNNGSLGVSAGTTAETRSSAATGCSCRVARASTEVNSSRWLGAACAVAIALARGRRRGNGGR
jgi:hypothetical protein